MLGTDSLIIALLFLVIGSLVYLGLRSLLRVTPRSDQLVAGSSASQSFELELPENEDAVIVVLPGGKIVYANNILRDWLNLPPNELPNLEHLARRTRPTDTFLSLCAAPGKSRFSLQGMMVDGVSYEIPYQSRNAVLLTLHRPDLTPLTRDDSNFSSEALNILSQLSVAMTSSVDLDSTIIAILESVERLIPSDISEVTIWNETRERLIPYRITGLPGMDRKLDKPVLAYKPGQGYTGHIFLDKKSLLVSNVDDFREVRPAIDRKTFPFQSYLGVPLLIAGEPIGTLELGSLSSQTYNSRDLEILEILSNQAAVALQHALTRQEEERRVAELTGLAKLAQAVGTLRETRDLFAHIIQSILPLLEVETLGFLIFNADTRRLQGQIPFVGIPDHFVALYGTEIAPGSPAEEIWLGGETIIAPNAPEDAKLAALGIAHLAQASGIQSTILAPLSIGGRSLGYVQVANKRGTATFTDDDLRILAIIAGQTAPIIENAALLQESRRRTRQAEALRRIAGLAGSAATLDEILKFSLNEVARLLRANHAAILLFDEERYHLRLHEESLFGASPRELRDFAAIPIEDPQYLRSATGSLRAFVYGNGAPDSEVEMLYAPIIRALGDQSALSVPIIVRDRGVGEMFLGSAEANFFHPGDIEMASSAAGQIAGALERAVLSTQTDENLRRRVNQLTALTRISRELNTSGELDHLLKLVYNEALYTSGADCGTLFLIEPDTLHLEKPGIFLSIGDRAADSALQPIESDALASGETRVVEDFDQSDYDPPHRAVRSALVVPVAHQRHIVGLFNLHANAAARFDREAVDIVQALAVQAAIAIGNAQRYRDQVERSATLKRGLDTLAKILETNQSLRGTQTIEQSLQAIGEGIREATPFQTVIISIFDPDKRVLRRACAIGFDEATTAEILQRTVAWSSAQEMLKPEFKQQNSYFIPHDRTATVVPADIHLVTVLDPEGAQDVGNHWHPEDIFFTPLFNADQSPLGIISVDAPKNGMRPDQTTIETLEIFATQAALTIESHRRLGDYQGQVTSLEGEVARAVQSSKLAIENLPVLLRKDLEQTLAVKSLNLRAHRVQASLDIIETLNRQPDRAGVFRTLGEELVSRMGFDHALIAETSERGAVLTHIIGELPEKVNPEALLGQRNPLRQTLQSGEMHLVPNLRENGASGWSNSPLLANLNAQSFISLPIFPYRGGAPEAALLGISRAAIPEITPEDQELFAMLTRQATQALQNLNLRAETEERLREVGLLLNFSRQLGSLDPAEILRSLMDSLLDVLTAAHGGMVLLWDESTERLLPQYAVGYRKSDALLAILFPPTDNLPGRAFSEGRTLRVGEVNIASEYNLPYESLLKYQEATEGRVPISSLAMPLQSSGAKLGVLVLDNFNSADAFSEEDEALAASLVRQTELILENARLLEDAEDRALQLQSLTKVATTITSDLQVNVITASLLDHLSGVLPFDTGTFWFRQADQLSIRAAQGFGDDEERVGLVVAVSDSRLLNEMIDSGQPINVPDVHKDERFPALMEHQRLSWFGIPLIAKGEVVGVIALEKTEPHFYTQEHIQLATTFAGQAAIALENARLFEDSQHRSQELDERTQRLDLLNRLSNEFSSSLDVARILAVTVETMRAAIDCLAVSAVVFHRDGTAWLEAEAPGTESPLPAEFDTSPFETLRESLGVIITEDVAAEAGLAPLKKFWQARGTKAAVILSAATGEELHGLLILHGEGRFSSDEIDLARTISNQVAVALQNAELFGRARRLAEDLEQRVEARTAELALEHERTETLLGIITELSASLDMDIVLNRTLGLINKITNAQSSTIMLANPADASLMRRASLGYTTPVPEGGEETSLALNEGLAGWVISNRQPALIPDIQQDDRWISHGTTAHRSAIAVPLMLGAEALGALMLFHPETDQFSGHHLDLIEAAAKQIAVALNNAQLYHLIRDQAERLGGMLRNQQIEASRLLAILEAVADGVLVTDAHGEISVFNASAERILNLASRDVIGKPLDNFTGFFGKAGQHWMETIRDWSADPRSYRSETFSEEIHLEDNRVVAVNLAPVSSPHEFLGTVSIFRDITHLIEVDRLKSEFVATVSHELRTPLTSIKGYVDILLMGAAGKLSDQQWNFLQVVQTNTERLNILVNDLLEVSRIEAGKIALVLQSMDVVNVVNEVVTDYRLRSQEEQKNLQIEVDGKFTPPRVLGDPERVRQVLDNLISNAYQYTPSDGRITVSFLADDEFVRVDIKDTGVGVSPEDQERVFERFFRGEAPLVASVAGTGLGLSIVQYLVHLHGGEIWLKSSGVPGDGTTFSFTLPIYEED
jgi:PAS domain S-box-containing protein